MSILAAIGRFIGAILREFLPAVLTWWRKERERPQEVRIMGVDDDRRDHLRKHIDDARVHSEADQDVRHPGNADGPDGTDQRAGGG